MKTVGIIGGLGPETTAEFYLEIIFGCYKENKVQRPPILIWNVPLEFKIEEQLLTNATGEDKYIPYLVDAAKRLEKGGADFLVMPCNSLHIFIHEIRSAVTIPVLSIVEETTQFLKSKQIDKVGLLATNSSLKNQLYESSFQKEKIEQIVPNTKNQEKLGRVIHNIVMKKHEERDREDLLEIIATSFQDKEVNNIILACTDLQIIINNHPDFAVYDTMKILADATIREILA